MPSVRLVAMTTAAHIASGSCSAPPSGNKVVGTDSPLHATVTPLRSTSATFGPPDPRSIASTHPSLPWSPVTARRYVTGRPAGACYTGAVKSVALQLLGPSTGGIRVHVGELARRLEARGWATPVVGPTGVMDGVGEQAGDVDVPGGWHPWKLLRARRQLGEALDGAGGTDAVSVLHAHGLKTALLAESLPRRRRPPVVLTVHNLVVGSHHGPGAWLLAVLERRIVRRADHVIAISDEIAEYVEHLASGRWSFVLPVAPTRTVSRPSEEVRAEHGIDPDAPLVVIVARHHEQKDLPTFLGAMDAVRRRVPAARAVMVGDGPDRPFVERERNRLGLEDVVVIAGFRPNPADEMHAADVVVSTSRWEGSPIVVAECLQLGKPLVTTAVGTVVRHLHDGVDARVVPIGDAAACADAIVDLLDHPDVAAALGAAGHEVAVAVFDADRLVDGVEAAYRSATG